MLVKSLEQKVKVMTKKDCLIWQVPAKDIPTKRDAVLTDSPRAGGRYLIARSACAMLSDFDALEKVLLTSWLVEQRRLGVPCPEIFATTLKDVKKRQPLSVHARADNLLRYLDDKSDLFGTVVSFHSVDNVDYPETKYQLLAWTDSQELSEVIALAEFCGEQGWIDHHIIRSTELLSHSSHRLKLKPSGLAYLAKFAGTNSGSNQAFIAMWFDESMEDAYEKGIAPAVREAGYEPLRIDQKDHNNKIDDEIIAEIKRSRFLVADFTQGETGARGGVYYEAGLAHGLNIQVIFTCREDALDDVHFDTRQYNHITWNTPEELRKSLVQRISATIGDGPSKKS